MIQMFLFRLLNFPSSTKINGYILRANLSCNSTSAKFSQFIASLFLNGEGLMQVKRVSKIDKTVFRCRF